MGIWLELANSASFFGLCVSVGKLLLVFAKTQGFVARKLWILVKREGFFAKICDGIWWSSCLLARLLEVSARYSYETDSYARAPTVKDGAVFAKIS